MTIPVIVIITIVCYFGLLVLVSWFASRGSDNATFFTGNRKAAWPLAALATMGAAISGVTFISVPGMVVSKGHSYIQMSIGFVVGYLVIAFVLIPLFYRKNLVSIYGYLEERFGKSSYKSGAWIFFVSKMLGAAARFFVVCAVLQLLVFDPLHIPFWINVVVTIALIWLYTKQGGVKTVLWTDCIKSICLVGSVVLCICLIAGNLGFNAGQTVKAISEHHSFKILYFDDPSSNLYFWKQFVAGIFLTIAMTGLDQDMMQRSLACDSARNSQKNMVVGGIVQFFVIALFLLLGTMLMIFMEHNGLMLPSRTDDLFGIVATHSLMPTVVTVLFVLGLVSAAYAAAGSALTSLTTSFTVDILAANKKDDASLTRTRQWVHRGMSAIMGMIIVGFYYINEQDAISTVYTLASYTYGPILGLFVFGMFSRRAVKDSLVPYACLLSPLLSWLTQWALSHYLHYSIGFELLLLNAGFTILSLFIISESVAVEKEEQSVAG